MVDEDITLTGTAMVTAGDISVLFDIIENHTININNNITDNYLESGSAITDAIIHQPLTVSVKGCIGEVVYNPNTPQPLWIQKRLAQQKVSTAETKLRALTGILPPVDNITQLAMNTVDYIEASVNRYGNAFGLTELGSNIRNKATNTLKKAVNKLPFFNLKVGEDIAETSLVTNNQRLSSVYNALKIISDNNTSVDIVTPFTTFKGLYIQSITLSQDNENYKGDISLILKQIRYTVSVVTSPNKKVVAAINSYQTASEQNNGKTQGTKQSLLKSGFGQNLVN